MISLCILELKVGAVVVPPLRLCRCCPQSPGVLAALDATVHKAAGERFKISGFPTLMYFERGEEKYTMPQLRNKDKIIEFMHK